MLIAHNESKILATIKSRCLLIRMPIIDNETFLKTLSLKRPNINRKDLDLLKEISANALGDAIENYQEYPKIYGYLIEDLLLNLLDDNSFLEPKERLKKIKNDCLKTEIINRPSFSEIINELNTI